MAESFEKKKKKEKEKREKEKGMGWECVTIKVRKHAWQSDEVVISSWYLGESTQEMC